jgi:probable HAF family extracellular repeat protein
MKRSLLSILLIVILLAPTGVAQRGQTALAANSQPSPQAVPPIKPRYTITDLGTLGGGSSQAFGINKKGQVVGQSSYHAFSWEDGTMTDLGTLVGGQQSSAEDINVASQVVGWSQTSGGDGERHAFLWQNGAMQDLGTLGGLESGATAINNSGQVVGFAEIVDNTDPSDPYYWPHAFLWQDGSLQDLGTLSGQVSYATDINQAGQVVGAAEYNLDASHAVLWQNGVIQDLGTLGGDYSWANAVNNAGQVVGSSSLLNTESHAFLWHNGAMQDLGTLGEGSNAIDINDSGQVVGTSYLANWVEHAFLWENGQMKDLNTLIPADSGWVLGQAQGINQRGQIVGRGVFNGQVHAYLLTPHLPVLIVPGIAGTYSDIAVFDHFWLTNRGVHPDNLQIDPLGRVYDDLIQTFKNLGYEEGKDLFVVNYDWRLPPGPSDNEFDGHIGGLDAQTLADEQFNYAVDYLGYYLRQAAEAYRLEYGGELPQVNLISHSTGGLVARTYIQSDAYGGVYDPAHDYHLPTIDQFIMVGVPNRGASKAWNPIHDNWGADVIYRVVLSKILNGAYQKVLHGETISGPDYIINLASISPNGAPDPVVFIEKYVPTLRALLATYEFIDFGEGFVHVNDDPSQRNALVLDLNNGQDLMPTLDPSPFADETNTTVICGAGGSTATLVAERTGDPAEDVLLPFTDFFPNDADANDVWYEDVWLAQSGDETVPLISCRDQFLGDARVDILLFDGAHSDHTGLMSNVAVQSAMLDVLKVEYESQNISTGTGASLINAISVISDPAETMLVDGAGRRLGYSQATGVLTEIPGSTWFGQADGFGFVTGAVTDPLHLELTGLGEDYYVMASVERNGKPAGGAVNSGYLAQGQKITVPITLSNDIFLPLIIR